MNRERRLHLFLKGNVSLNPKNQLGCYIHLLKNKLFNLQTQAMSRSLHIRRALLPAATKLGQGNVFTGVCDSVHRGGVCLSACWDTTTPPGADIPRDQTSPPGSRRQHTVNERPVRILLECILVN